jgi:hypothetical protein
MRNRESCYLLTKTVRPAPGAQSRPRANPEREEGDRVRQLCRVSKPACVHFADRVFIPSFVSLLLGVDRIKVCQPDDQTPPGVT